MFKEGKYEKQIRLFSANGMNRDVSPLSLGKEFAIYLDNFIPLPKGEGTVRYGTKLIYDGSGFPPTSEIIYEFPAYSPNGSKQIVSYVRDFILDQEAGDFDILEDTKFSVTGENFLSYKKNYKIFINYTIQDVGTFDKDVFILDVVFDNNQQKATITLSDFIFPENTTINQIYYPSGSLYVYKFEDLSLLKIKEGLSPYCLPQGVTYKANLLMCNGFDRVMRWDGAVLNDVIDYVEELAVVRAFARTGNNTFTFTAQAGFVLAKYQNGRIRIEVNSVPFETNVTQAVLNGQTVTITTEDVLPQFVDRETVLYYRDYVPRFNFMIVLHDRIFGLGEGVSDGNYRAPDQAMRVYFQYRSNDLFEWFNPQTKTVPSIDLSDKHGVPDNFEAISFISGYTLFLGRKRIQVWTGTEPEGAAVAVGRTPLQYTTSLDLGLFHPRLLVKLANEIIIANESGIFSLRTTNISRQVTATSIPQMNSLILDKINRISDINNWIYTCSVHYPTGNFFIFRIGKEEAIVAFVDGSIASFGTFSGDFAKANCFLASLDNSLYMAKGNKIFQYADESVDVPLFGDNGGEELISFMWALSPFQGGRWTNSRIVIDMQYPSNFILKENNELIISVRGDRRKSFEFETSYLAPLKGDIMDTVPLLEKSEHGDGNSPTADELGFRLDIPFLLPFKRLKFVSSTFFILIRGSTNSGKLSLKKITLFGKPDRRS